MREVRDKPKSPNNKKEKPMILRLAVHPAKHIAESAFVHESKVLQTVHLTYDFRNYEQLDKLFPAMRTKLWNQFGDNDEIFRELESNSPSYFAAAYKPEEHFMVLWEFLQTLN
jgi:hypothetical protein